MSSETIAVPLVVDGACIDRVQSPASVLELCEVLTDVNAADQHALIVGGGTRLSFGNVGGPFDLAISTRALNRILHYEPDDLTLAVEPGCTIAEVTDLLGKSGQVIALDAAHADRSTIGGAYAAGMSGPRRLGGGSLKDWVIGIEVAGADGVIAKAGGMVVKNVTGYDMMHVHHGALGAFGVVTRLNLKVFPVSGASQAVVMSYQTASEAHSAGCALLQSQLQPSSMIVANDFGWTLRVRCDAPLSAIERQAQRLIDAASKIVPPVNVEVSPLDSQAISPFLDVTDLLSNGGVARLSIAASKQLGAIEVLASASRSKLCADLGSGILYVAAANPDQTWIDRMRSVDPRPVFLALPSELKRPVEVFGGFAEANAEIVRRMKVTFDPHGRFNRGRFVLGL